MSKDIASIVKIVNTTVAPSVTADTDYASVDTVDFNGIAIQFDVGAVVGAGSLLPVIQVSDDDIVWATADPNELDYAPVNIVVAQADTKQKFNYVGCKRYVRVQADVTGTIDVKVNVTYVLGAPRNAPVPA